MVVRLSGALLFYYLRSRKQTHYAKDKYTTRAARSLTNNSTTHNIPDRLNHCRRFLSHTHSSRLHRGIDIRSGNYTWQYTRRAHRALLERRSQPTHNVYDMDIRASRSICICCKSNGRSGCNSTADAEPYSKQLPAGRDIHCSLFHITLYRHVCGNDCSTCTRCHGTCRASEL